ncbi:small ribosomal subunit protein uS2m-like [Clavelina lepadiformis]|uniref:small ribosomal subunit protein uS2m-like n=1 Tax=Clavelina lepadiformis TaxID=159417 RepID=UPI00404108F0
MKRISTLCSCSAYASAFIQSTNSFSLRTLTSHQMFYFKSSMKPLFPSSKTQQSFLRTVQSEPKIQVATLQKNTERENPLLHSDFFGVKSLVTIEDLYKARVHFGHTKGCRNELMKPYLFGCRLGTDIFDLDVTLQHLHRALNFLAHMAFRKAIILFIMKSHQHGHAVEKLAQECGEFAHTRAWGHGTFTNNKINPRELKGGIKLPDLCVFLSLQDTVQDRHLAIDECAKVGIATIGICDSNVNPSIITYPVPANDDSLQSIELFCSLFKKAVLLGKEKRLEIENSSQSVKTADSTE